MLVHRGRGGGITDVFGGGIASGIQCSAVGERNLSRITWGVAIVWGMSIVLIGLIQTIRGLTSPKRIKGIRHGRWQCYPGVARRRGPMGEAERGESAPRQMVSYYCAKGHVTRPSFAIGDDREIPAEWDCPVRASRGARCGQPAGADAK